MIFIMSSPTNTASQSEIKVTLDTMILAILSGKETAQLPQEMLILRLSSLPAFLTTTSPSNKQILPIVYAFFTLIHVKSLQSCSLNWSLPSLRLISDFFSLSFLLKQSLTVASSSSASTSAFHRAGTISRFSMKRLELGLKEEACESCYFGGEGLDGG